MTFILTAWFRFCIIIVPMQRLKERFGISGEESSKEASVQEYKIASRVARIVNRVATHTPWESKCLVRALTAQKLLKHYHISSTLYLGVGKENDTKMIAHAWLRCGEYYVSGGQGEGYAQVAKFRA